MTQKDRAMVKGLHGTCSSVRVCSRLSIGLLASLFIVWVAPCRGASMPPRHGTWSGAFPVGENRIGEPCRVVSPSKAVQLPQGVEARSVACGKWEEPSARVFTMGGGPGPVELAGSGWWRDRLDSFANCGPAIPTKILDGIDAVALDCSFRVGGWPYQALAARIGERTYLAETIPAAYPATERAIGVLAGRLPRSQATQGGVLSEETRRLESRLAASSYSAGDLTVYRDLVKLGQYYNFQANFPEAEQRYRRALALQQKVVAAEFGEKGFLDMHIALELSNQGRIEVAEAVFAKAEALVAQSLEPTDEARLVSYRAIHLANQRKDREALAAARKATAMRRELARGYGVDPALASSPMTNLVSTTPRGQVRGGETLLSPRGATALGDIVQSRYLEAAMLVEVGDLGGAKDALREAEDILAREPRVPRRWLPQIRFMQARIAEQENRWSEAEALLLASIQAQHALYGDSRSEGLAYMALGRVRAGQGQGTKALEAFRKGFEIMGNLGGGIRFEDAAPFFKTSQAEAEANPARKQQILAEMFSAGQLVRGITAAQSMSLAAARLAAGEDAVGNLIRQLQDARQERDALREKLTLVQAEPGVLAPQVSELEKQWDASSARVADLERQVQAAAPRYNQVIDRPVSVEDLIGVLRPGELLVQILVGPKSSFGFIADAKGISGYGIDLSESQALELVNRLRKPLDAVDVTQKFPVDEAFALFKRLFGPVQDRVSASRHIIAVPSGPLLNLPLGILVTAQPDWVLQADYSSIPWMARKHAITHAPSVQSFVNLRTAVRPSRAPAGFIGFGDFVPHGDADAVMAALDLPKTCREEAHLLANLPELPNTGRELREVAAMLHAPEKSLVLGRAFTEAAVKKAKLDDYRIIYFATHGLLPQKLRCLPEPALVVSMSSREGEASDGLLSTSEVIGLHLDADVVVLSACDTSGPAAGMGGEALSGLARAFLYAGARSLVVSQWEIPEKSTVKLMTMCFEQLKDTNLTLSEAMMRAQAALIENPTFSHPLAWGAFVVVGDGGQRPGERSVTMARQ